MEDNNFIKIIIWALVIGGGVVLDLVKKAKKKSEAKQEQAKPTPIEFDILPIETVRPKRNNKVKKPAKVPKQERSTFTQEVTQLPEEGIRMTSRAPMASNQSNERKSSLTKDEIRKMIIYGELLAPKF